MTIPYRSTSLGPSRRQVLAGGAAMAFLAACGGDDDGAESGGSATPGDLSVVRFAGPYFAAGAAARVPFGLADSAGLLPLADTPAEVTVTAVIAPAGDTVVEGVVVPRYDTGLPRPYFAFEVTPPVPGFYDLVLDVDGAEVISQFEVQPADDAVLAGRVDPGDVFPSVPTPTPDDDQGVTPICTREPGCDLHASSLDDVLGTGPVALLIATPAFCQTVICGPVLDVLLGVVDDFPEVTFVHAEVFTNPFENEGQFTADDYAPIIAETGLPYEPVLYTIGADGVVVGRLDYIFAEEEMRTALAALGS